MIAKLSALTLIVVAAVILLEQGETGLDLIGNILVGNFSLTPSEQFVLVQLRLPPVLAAILAGAAFGLSGTLFQTQLRNSLASPDVLGVVGGASAGVLGAMVFGIEVSRSLAAVLGAVIATAMVFVMGWRGAGVLTPLIITGLAIGYLAAGLTRFFLAKADLQEVGGAYGWLVGSTRLATLGQLAVLAAIILAGGLVLYVAQRPLKALELGAETAQSIGFRVDAWSISLLAVAVLLATFATAATGPLAFVALLAGPIAARLGRSGYANLILSALVGALLVLTSDLISVFAFRGLNLPTGLFTGVVGSVFLVRLVMRSVRGVSRV